MNDAATAQQPRDMRQFARDAIELLGDADAAALAGDKMRQYAVTRALELVGEAAAQVARDVQATMPAIPWREAIGTRHRLIHGYGSVDLGTLVETVRTHLPPLIADVSRSLGDEPPDSA